MDVAKTNIEKIGGTVELKSEQGRGSTFVIKIPLTDKLVENLLASDAFVPREPNTLVWSRVTACPNGGTSMRLSLPPPSL